MFLAAQPFDSLGDTRRHSLVVLCHLLCLDANTGGDQVSEVSVHDMNTGLPADSAAQNEAATHKISLIETSRLVLRPHRMADLDDAHGVLGDPETMAHYPEPYSKERVKRIIEKNIETFASARFGMMAVIEKAGGRFIGDCGITIQNIDGQEEFEIGFRISKQKWGFGFAPEAAIAVKRYGFEDLRIPKLYSHMASDHVQSRRVAEKIGMKLEKEFRNPRNRGYLTAVYSEQIERSLGEPSRGCVRRSVEIE